MTLSSMTGFARRTGSGFGHAWAWELKSVNGKGLEIRCRLPYGQEMLEIEIRKRAAALLSRGSVTMNLTLSRDRAYGEGLDPARLRGALLALRDFALSEGLPPPVLSDVLAVKGAAEAPDPAADEAETAALQKAVLDDFDAVIAALAAARKAEGAAVTAILEDLLGEIEETVKLAQQADGARLEAIRSRFAGKVAELVAPGMADPARMEQEIALLAVKADVREELDRLQVHIAAARLLLESGDAAGRKLDFLAQEFMREANTLCSKSLDSALTAAGLRLKAAIGQFREQIQNVE